MSPRYRPSRSTWIPRSSDPQCDLCWKTLKTPHQPHFCRGWTKSIAGTCPFCEGIMKLEDGYIPSHHPRISSSAELTPEQRNRLEFVCFRPRVWKQKDPMPVLPLEFAPILRAIAALDTPQPPA